MASHTLVSSSVGLRAPAQVTSAKTGRRAQLAVKVRVNTAMRLATTGRSFGHGHSHPRHRVSRDGTATPKLA